MSIIYRYQNHEFTIDNAVYNMVTRDEVVEKPFLSKSLMYVADNNPSSTYSTNQVTFTTEVLSNNGKYNSYAEGFISIPNVIAVTGTLPAGKTWANLGTDLLLAMKNSNVNLLHSMKVDYNNGQGVDYINTYYILLFSAS